MQPRQPPSLSNRTHACIIGGGWATAWAQIYPFFIYQAELAERIGLTFSHSRAESIEEILAAAQKEPFQLIFIQSICFDGASNKAVERTLIRLREIAPVVLLDVADSCDSRYYRFLHCLDAYLTKAMYADRSQYEERYLDGRPFADYWIRANHPKYWFRNIGFFARHLKDGEAFARFMARTTRRNLAGAAYLRNPGIDPEQADKIMLGWGLGNEEKVYQIFKAQSFQPDGNQDRPIDVHCRVKTKMGFYCDWYYFQRHSTIDCVKQLAPGHNVVATNARVRHADYARELKQSKIVISPFGWGEICIRDYEAIVAGCLLIKPDTGHLTAVPDIFQPGETYVPVKWDLSDLPEKCRYYLDHEDERARIIAQAGKAYARYFKDKRFVEQTGELLQKLGWAQ